MEVILSYLDNMFLNMPKTTEVLRAKKEIGAMMEDKYNELCREGKKQNEAIGIVISEFGNLEELAEELNIVSIVKEAEVKQNNRRKVSREEGEAYLSASQKTIKWIAFAILLCICCPIPLLTVYGMAWYMPLTDMQLTCLGLIPMFIIIGIAVAIFIYNGVKMERFEYLKKEEVEVDSNYRIALHQMDENEKTPATKKLTIGILFCIFSVIPLLIAGSATQNEFIQCLAIDFLLLSVAIGVLMMVIGENKRECIKVLLQEGEYARGEKKKNKIVSVIARIYWPIVTVIYLCWSLTTMRWGNTWIVWPVAGILFWGIAAVCSTIVETRKTSKMG